MTPLPRPTPVPLDEGRGRRVSAVLAAVVLVLWFDQVSKAWAWRTRSGVQVDTGGGYFVSNGWGSLWSDGTTGPLLDVVGLVALAAAALAVVRRRRSRSVLFGASLAVAGFASNLADRLGLHTWTAPGSPRGVVDFLVWNGRVWNLADATIATGLTLFTLGVVMALVRPMAAPRPPGWHPETVLTEVSRPVGAAPRRG